MVQQVVIHMVAAMLCAFAAWFHLYVRAQNRAWMQVVENGSEAHKNYATSVLYGNGVAVLVVHAVFVLLGSLGIEAVALK